MNFGDAGKAVIQMGLKAEFKDFEDAIMQQLKNKNN
jgi:hypothetical protein